MFVIVCGTYIESVDEGEDMPVRQVQMTTILSLLDRRLHPLSYSHWMYGMAGCGVFAKAQNSPNCVSRYDAV
jgi:hypothetical protein